MRERAISSPALMVVFACTAIALAALAYGPLGGSTFVTVDAAIKYLQASALVDSAYRSMALAYPASVIDHDRLFIPFELPYVFRGVTGYESVFSTAYAILTAPVAHLGPSVLRALSIFGGASTAVATALLAERSPRWIPAILITFATPVWYYATASGETTLALAASTLAFVLASREGPVDVWCGLLIGAAGVLRDESLLLVPGLLYARYRYARGSAAILPALLGAAAPVALVALLEQVWLRRPVLAHLRNGVPLLNEMLPRMRAILPGFPPFSWADRYNTIVHYWLLGGGTPLLALGVAAILLVAFALRNRSAGPIVVALALAAAAIVQWRDIIPLLSAPRFAAGLLHLSPLLLFALLPAPPGSSHGPARSIAFVTSVTFLALTWVTLNTAAGKSLGPRLTIALWPLLVASAWDGFRAWSGWSGPRPIRNAIVLSGLALIAGSLVMELAVALPAWTDRVHDDEKALSVVRSQSSQILVLDDEADMQLVGAEYFTRRVLLVAEPRLWQPLMSLLTSTGEHDCLVVSRMPKPPRAIAPFRLSDERQVGRYYLRHYLR